MALRQRYQTIECKTIDGINLEAWFYPVEGLTPAPAIIMSHGFNCVKEMSVTDTAEGFQSAGFNVFLYDARTIGGSGGSPRNQINPMQIVEDVSDVVTHASRLPGVDARRILLWGMSFGGTISACAAAIDRRVAAVLMVCPIFSFIRPDRRAKAFAQLMRDRESQLRGNEPFTLQPFNSKGENPIGFAGSGGPGGQEAYSLMRAAAERGHANFRDRITLQSYHKMALFRPREVMEELLETVPTMMMVPELDDMSPAAEQIEVFESLRTPKRMYLAKGKGHLSILSGEGAERLLDAEIAFFEAALKGEIK